MVVVELRGGLGNQMFQYACAKSFSLKHKQPLSIDTSFLEKNQIEKEGFTPRKYELDIFALNDPFASGALVDSFWRLSTSKKIKRALNLSYKKIYRENEEEGHVQLNNIAPPVLLTGYWQSEQYFAEYTNVVREAFSFCGQCPDTSENILKNIENTNAVSVHFRRGDYVTSPIASKIHGVLDMDYYKNAIKKIEAKVDKPVFYIFSDDIEWAKANSPDNINNIYQEKKSDHKDWFDMFLMSKCKHHIIANSSYSWWGAWLNPSPHKIVIAPKTWFANEKLNTLSTDIIPKQWIKI